MDVTQTQNVMDHLYVELITVKLDKLGLDAAQHNAIITLTVQVENAMVKTDDAV